MSYGGGGGGGRAKSITNLQKYYETCINSVPLHFLFTCHGTKSAFAESVANIYAFWRDTYVEKRVGARGKRLVVSETEQNWVSQSECECCKAEKSSTEDLKWNSLVAELAVAKIAALFKARLLSQKWNQSRVEKKIERVVKSFVRVLLKSPIQPPSINGSNSRSNDGCQLLFTTVVI